MLGDFIKRIVKGTLSAAARTSNGEFLLRKTDYGLVRIEYVVVQKIAERALEYLRGVQDVEVMVEKNISTVTPIKIQLTLTLTEGYSALRVGEAARNKINEALKSLLDPGFYVPVSVEVNRIEQQLVTKKRRVR